MRRAWRCRSCHRRYPLAEWGNVAEGGMQRCPGCGAGIEWSPQGWRWERLILWIRGGLR